jgi:site-specific recombinase XerD
MITVVAFRDYLEKEKKYSLHTVSGYLKDVENFSLLMKHILDNL